MYFLIFSLGNFRIPQLTIVLEKGPTMRTLKSVKRFFNNDKGATAIEYGLIAGGIAIVIIVAVGLAGDALVAMFNTIATALTPAPTV